jgi:hypothetical protein
MLPVLIVCYLRPQKLRLILESLVGSNRRIYIFIDTAPDELKVLSQEVSQVAREFSSILEIKIDSPPKNLGVKLGVPRGLDWALSFEERVIVLEDDCLPTQYAYEYFDSWAPKLSGQVQMVCATSAVNIESDSEFGSLTYSNYPLIWGWATSAENWANLRELIEGPVPHKRVLTFIFKNPRKVLATSYFYAAAIRINQGRMQAWDALVALEMIISQFRSIIPNKTLVTNVGRDEQANHFSHSSISGDETVNYASGEAASTSLDESRHSQLRTDKKIERNIYNLRKRHLLSPLKALLRN